MLHLDTGNAIALASIACGFLCAIAVCLIPSRPVGDAKAATWIVAILVFVTFEFWFLGPYSFAMSGDETEALTKLHWLSHDFIGGQFAADYAGGNDVYGVTTGGKGLEAVSLEGTLFRYLPIWLAAAVIHVYVNLAALAGSYLLVRRVCGATPGLAVAAALVFVGSFHPLVNVTTNMGIGWLGTPLLTYVVVARSREPGYWWPVIAMAALYAVSSMIVFTLPATVLAVIGVAVVMGSVDWRRIIAATALISFLEFLNWAEWLWHVAQILPYSMRGSVITLSRGVRDLPAMLLEKVELHLQMPSPFVYAVLALVILWVFDRRFAGRAAVAMLVSLTVGPVLKIVPFSRLGLHLLDSYDWTYLEYSFYTFALLILARAAVVAREHIDAAGAWRKIPLAALVLMGMSDQAMHKIDDVVHYLDNGGVAETTAIPNLRQPDWLDRAPAGTRVVSFPYRITPWIVAAYGVPTFDGYINVMPASRGLYWVYAQFHGDLAALTHGQAYLQTLDPRCCRSYRLADDLDLELLRMGGVGFIVSDLPLTGAGLTKISGPADDKVPPRRGDGGLAKLESYVHRIVDPGPVFVYAVADPAPLAYGATSVESVDEPDTARFYGLVRSAFARHVAVVRRSEAPVLPAIDGAINVLAVRTIKDGFTVQISAPSGGLLVLNTPWTPFWHATDNSGTVAMAFPVNGIQLGVVVPAGTSDLVLRYHVRTLLEALTGLKDSRN
jgi:hypothetical protein